MLLLLVHQRVLPTLVRVPVVLLPLLLELLLALFVTLLVKIVPLALQDTLFQPPRRLDHKHV